MKAKFIVKPVQKKNPLLYVLPLLVGVAFILLFGFYLVSIFLFPAMFGKCVAVVKIDGPLMAEDISASLFSDAVPGSEDMANQIRALNDREDIAAIVFVINSPGGSVVASREIYDAVNSLDKPTVSYFRETAASGAYYISTPTDYIISDPYAITGSIGVISSGFEMSGLLEKLGVNSTTVTTGDHKDIGSELRPMTEEEQEILNEMLALVFEDFKSVIVENRGDKLNNELFEEALDGRIMLGIQAKEVGLVDEVGTKQDAIIKAAELAEMEGEVRTCEIGFSVEQKGLFDMVSFINALLVTGNNYGLKYSLE